MDFISWYIIVLILLFSMNLSLCSDVWEHFKRMENTTVCCHCKKELSYCKTTTNLIDHLPRMHPSKYLQNAEKKIEVKTNIDSFVKKTQRSYKGNHTTDCRNNGTGFKASGNGGFRCLINYIQSDYRVPSAMHITHAVSTREIFTSQKHSDRNAKGKVTHRINDRYLDKCCHPSVYNCYGAYCCIKMRIEDLLITNCVF